MWRIGYTTGGVASGTNCIALQHTLQQTLQRWRRSLMLNVARWLLYRRRCELYTLQHIMQHTPQHAQQQWRQSLMLKVASWLNYRFCAWYTLQHTATRTATHIATDCNTLQHTLQHTATHIKTANTLQQILKRWRRGSKSNVASGRCVQRRNAFSKASSIVI